MPHVEASERTWIRDAKAGNAEAFEHLVRRHWSGAFRAAYLVVHDAGAAEDIVQESLLSAIRSLDRFDRRRPFGPWLHRIVVNRAIDWARARAHRAEVGDELLTLAPAGEPVTGGPYSEATVAALAALPVEQRAVIVLRHLLDYSPGEIATLLGLPRGTVNSRLRRGLDTLAGLLEEEQ
jgi:RNA polymerase sigma-70 factor, ECF subfamily